MKENLPHFPQDFTPDPDAPIDNEKVNKMIEELLNCEGNGTTSVLYDPPYIVINRDPARILSHGKVIVILQVVMIADYEYR